MKELERQIGTLAVFAARYARSRETGAAFACVTAIKRVWRYLDEKSKAQIINETGNEATTCLDDWRDLIQFSKEQP